MELAKRVAVVTRTRNRPQFLLRAAESVRSQTCQDFVWVVVNDGGERAGVDTIADQMRCSGMDVQVIHHDKCLGRGAAANSGITAAKSEFIAIHDDDDGWYPGFLDAGIAFLDSKSNFQAVVCGVDEIRERFNNGVFYIISKKQFYPKLTRVFTVDLVTRNLFPPIAMLFRRSAYSAVGPFDVALPVLEDWEFNVRLAMAGDIGVISDTLASYHVRVSESANGDAGNSIVSERHLHEEYTTILHNRWVRQFMSTGLGPGGILAISHLLKQHRLGRFIWWKWLVNKIVLR
ncbi:MAG: glycosyltransferase family 2 protein [Sulfurimonas sp.]|nr:glycosyltransferase family 2 protein [Sulfurimonas sp.]